MMRVNTQLLFLMVSVTACASSSSDDAAGDEALGESSAAQTDPNDPSWSCYDPEPGHPTSAEKQAFITRTAVAAQEAERTYGVPAAAIVAMAAVEGGYGYTRIAKYANNSFGYKFSSSTSANGRDSYTLSCQPSWDVGNKYIVFSSIRDGVLFIAFKLGTRNDWANYKSATDAYRTARASGMNATTATNAWIDGIADEGYNYDPPTYKRTIKSVMASWNTYQYSASIMPLAPATPSSPSSSSSASWIAIDAPNADAYVSGNVALRATASAGVTKVTFVSITSSGSEYVLGSASAPSFVTTWATNGYVPSGAYSIRYEAYAGSTKVAQATRRVHVSN